MIRPGFPFYMLRHGETDWNAERRFQGQIDIAMNAKGRRQAADYAALMGGERDDWTGWRFVSSPLSRARQTMEIMRAAMALPPTDYDVEDDLIEVTFGQWERRTLDELASDEPALMAQRQADKWTFVPPGGESYAKTAERVGAFLERLDGPSVIVAHGGIIRGTRHLVEGVDGHQAAESAVPQDNIYRFDGDRASWLR